MPSWLWVTSGWNWMPEKRSFQAIETGVPCWLVASTRAPAGITPTVSEWLIHTCDDGETPS